MAVRLLLLLVLIATAVLGYGYWQGATHATFYISVQASGGAAGGQGFVPGAELILRDAKGRELARGRNDERYNFVRLSHPQLGDCHAAEQAATTGTQARTAWQACFEQQARWIPRWAEKVQSISLRTPDCGWVSVPVKVHKYGADWLLWWVPLPHVGGKPYTYYSLNVSLPEQSCAVPE
jgi:hypothetical protein